MAHGSKKWITDWRGRLKRSRNRTWLDRRGKHVRPSYRYEERDCNECRGLPWWHRCGECQRIWERFIWCYGWRKHTGARRMELERRRRSVRNMLQRAKYVPELYDYIPTKHKNGWLD